MNMMRKIGRWLSVRLLCISQIVSNPEAKKNKDEIEFAQPEDIAEEIYRISQQKRSAWSFDVELRPDIEKW